MNNYEIVQLTSMALAIIFISLSIWERYKERRRLILQQRNDGKNLLKTINEAPSGAIVLLAGTFRLSETLEIKANNVQLKGGHLISEGNQDVIRVTANRVLLEGMRIHFTDGVAVNVVGADKCEIKNNLIECKRSFLRQWWWNRTTYKRVRVEETS